MTPRDHRQRAAAPDATPARLLPPDCGAGHRSHPMTIIHDLHTRRALTHPPIDPTLSVHYERAKGVALVLPCTSPAHVPHMQLIGVAAWIRSLTEDAEPVPKHTLRHIAVQMGISADALAGCMVVPTRRDRPGVWQRVLRAMGRV